MLGVTAGTILWFHGWNTFHLPLRTLEIPIMLVLLELSLLCLGAGDLSLDARRGGSKSGSAGAGAARRRAA